MSYARMADAAFAANIPPGFDIAAGYYYGASAFHIWPAADWARFPGYRLPIAVPASPGNGPQDAEAAADVLKALGVPQGCLTVLDMETRVDEEYVLNFGAGLAAAGYKTWVYGSRSTVFGNPQLNGYWVADFGTSQAETIGLLETHGVRAVQYAAGLAPGYDASLVRPWTEGEMWHG